MRELQTLLANAVWRVANKTELPLACFVDTRRQDGESGGYLQAVADRIVASGAAWISTTRLKDGQPVLRACITNFRTEESDR